MAPREFTSLGQAWMALAGLSAVFLFEMLDNSVLTVALPTIGRELHASATGLQWVTASYAVVFGGLLLAFGALADRWGRRRVMLVGLVLLALASLATAFVQTAEELIAVRALMGVAAALTTPGSMALAFRLFSDDGLRVKATNLISTVGLVGLAIGPPVGGLVLGFAPWQVLLLANVPVAVLAWVGIRFGVAPDHPDDHHTDPIDAVGAALGTTFLVLALVSPTWLVDQGIVSVPGWVGLAGALLASALFVFRMRRARYPLVDLTLVARPLVSSGLLYKAASGMAMAGLGYLVTLQLQLDWGWSPAQAALGMLPQVVVLIAGGAVVSPVLHRWGFDKVAWLSAGLVVAGLAVYAVAGEYGYPWVALALVLEALGLRVVGVIAGTNVLRGLPANRTTIGVALVDTASQVMTGVGLAVAGTVLAAFVGGALTGGAWTADQTSQFRLAVRVAGLGLSGLSAGLVLWGVGRASRAPRSPDNK